MLEVRHLSKSFDGIKAVQDCSFKVDPNSITALIGPNGAGKTTVFNLLTGFIAPDHGMMLHKGESMIGLPPHRIANRGISRSFQLIRLFPKLSVMENLMLARTRKSEDILTVLFRPQIAKKENAVLKKRCLKALELVGLREKAHAKAENLPYGQQKLIEIARMLVAGSELILLDEPVAGVNPKMREKIKHILLKLKEEGKTILLIEHDLGFVMDLCDKVIVLDHGKEIAVGPPKIVTKDKKVLEAYLGDKSMVNIA